MSLCFLFYFNFFSFFPTSTPTVSLLRHHRSSATVNKMSSTCRRQLATTLFPYLLPSTTLNPSEKHQPNPPTAHITIAKENKKSIDPTFSKITNPTIF